MDVGLMREQFDADQNRRARERQLVLLGAVLASKDFRKLLQGIDGYDERLNAAIRDVVEPNVANKGTPDLLAVMADLGASDWKPGSGNPLRTLLEHVKVDGEIAWQWQQLAEVIDRTHWVRNQPLEEKRKALTQARRAVEDVRKQIGGAL